MRRRMTALAGASVLAFMTVLTGCNSTPSSDTATPARDAPAHTSAEPSASTAVTSQSHPVSDRNVYAAAGPGMLSATAARAHPYVYVPNTRSDTVDVIDPTSYKIVRTLRTRGEPQHVVPAWDGTVLWVNADHGYELTPIDPRTGTAGKPVPVTDPYNLYFTPDGSNALVMAEALHRIDVRDARTMALKRSLHVPCSGVNHADFDEAMSFFVASCEFSGKLLVIDKDAAKVRSVIDLNAVRTPGATSPMSARHMGGPAASLPKGVTAMPQDVRLTPDGRRFLVADMLRNGVWVVNATAPRIERFVYTGLGAHGIYPDRDGKRIFVTNRDQGTISVLEAATLTISANWKIPGHASPDMGGINADGSELWLSGRYDGEVYVINTKTGALTHRIKVGDGPHGLAVWPQPGRFSLGHTGNMR